MPLCFRISEGPFKEGYVGYIGVQKGWGLQGLASSEVYGLGLLVQDGLVNGLSRF